MALGAAVLVMLMALFACSATAVREKADFPSANARIADMLKGTGQPKQRVARDTDCNGMDGLCDLRFNQVTLPGTHNAGSGFDGNARTISGGQTIPCFERNQHWSFTEQLDHGIRVFDIDLCFIYNATEDFSPAGPWTCHGDGYAGPIEKVLQQIDDWMNDNPRDVVAINFNDDYDLSLTDDIAPPLHALLERFWDPTPERIADGNLTMNTGYNTSGGEWPTLGDAIAANQRVFVFMYVGLVLGGKPWAHPDTLYRSTFGTTIVTDTCEPITEHAQDRCDVCIDLVQISAFSSYGLCIFEMAPLCSLQLYNASDACYFQRIENGKTVNWIMIDFPDLTTSPNTVVEVAQGLNERNIDYYSIPRPTSVVPLSTPTACLPEPSPAPTPPTVAPPTNLCEALQQIATEPVGYFQCGVNDACDRLVCPVDLFETGFDFTFEIALLECEYPTPLEVILKDPRGGVQAEVKTNQTGTVEVLGLTVFATLEEVAQNSVGFQLTLPPTPRSSGTVIIDYIVVPINTTHCTNIDECDLELDDCSPNAICTDETPGYNCVCNDGFEGDGVECTAEGGSGTILHVASVTTTIAAMFLSFLVLC